MASSTPASSSDAILKDGILKVDQESMKLLVR